MAIAPISSRKDASSNTNGFTSGALDCTGANLLVVTISEFIGGGAGTLTDSHGNTWEKFSSSAAGFGQASEIWYAYNPSVSSSQTFSISGSGTFPSMCISAWSGAANPAFDQSNSNTWSGSATGQPGSVTPSENNELIIAALAGTQDAGTSINGGFTIAQNQALVTSFSYGCSLAYLIQTSAAAANPTWTTSDGAQNYAGAIATFKAAGGSPDVDIDIDTAGSMTFAGQSMGVLVTVNVTNGQMLFAGQTMNFNVSGEDVDIDIDTPGAIIFVGQAMTMAVVNPSAQDNRVRDGRRRGRVIQLFGRG